MIDDLFRPKRSDVNPETAHSTLLDDCAAVVAAAAAFEDSPIFCGPVWMSGIVRRRAQASRRRLRARPRRNPSAPPRWHSVSTPTLFTKWQFSPSFPTCNSTNGSSRTSVVLYLKENVEMFCSVDGKAEGTLTTSSKTSCGPVDV